MKGRSEGDCSPFGSVELVTVFELLDKIMNNDEECLKLKKLIKQKKKYEIIAILFAIRLTDKPLKVIIDYFSEMDKPLEGMAFYRDGGARISKMKDGTYKLSVMNDGTYKLREV